MKQIERTYWIALFNGGSVAGFAALCSIASIIWRPHAFTISACGLITASGIMEVIGGRHLITRQPASRWLLINSQLIFFITLAAYCFYQMNSQNIATSLASLPPEALSLLAEVYQLPPEELLGVLQVALTIIYGLLIVVSFFYQGGLLLYYANVSKKMINTALPY